MKHLYLVLLVCFPLIISSLDGGLKPFALAAADDDDDGDDDVDVEGEGEDTAIVDETGDEEEVVVAKTGVSPDAAITILFTKPISTGTSIELPAGHLVEFLVGFQNKGKQDFILETLEASFRYPMDFNFYIQNFSMIAYNKVVKPTHEATLAYSFMTPESFAGRPFGLNIHLRYRDFEGNLFNEAVFNETINIVELEEGLDGETFFLYVFLAALVVLLLVISQQFLVSVGKKRVGKKPVIETGTSNPNDVDMEWLPSHLRNMNNKNKASPKSSPRGNKNHVSPKASKHQQQQQQQQQQKQQKQQKQQHQSPKQRKAKRSAGRDD